jgi:hypothetical protein
MSARKPLRGGWSGGPVPADRNLVWALVCLAIGAGAVALMIWVTTGGGL